MLILGFIYFLLLYIAKDKIASKFKYLLAAIPLILIIVFRFGYGADYFSYEYIYYMFNQGDLLSSLNANSNIEPLFQIINMLFGRIGFSYHWFSVIYCCAILVLILHWLYETSSDFLLSVLLYFSMFFFVWNISALRQGLTIALLLYVFFNKADIFSLKAKIATVVISMLIHQGSIVFVILYLISKFNWKKSTLAILLFMGIIINLLPVDAIISNVSFFPFQEKILYYISEGSVSIFSLSSIMRLGFFFLVYFTVDLIDEKDLPKNSVNFILLGYVMYFCLMFADIVASRSAIYGYFMLLLYIPLLVRQSKTTILYKPIVASVLVFVSVSFYKESNSMMAQTGYNKSFLSFNFETILNKNYTNYDGSFALLGSVIDDHENNNTLTGKPSDSDLKIETEFNPNVRQISAYFNGFDRFGTINLSGEVVEMPEYEYRYNIIGGKAEMIIDPFRFPTIIYRTIGSQKGIPYEETQKIVAKDTWEKTRFNIFYNESKTVTYEDIDFSLVEDKFNFSSVKEFIVHKNGYYDNLHYLEMVSNTRLMYLILGENMEVINEKVYFNILKYDIKGVARGVTTNYADLIDKNGNVFWAEPIDQYKK